MNNKNLIINSDPYFSEENTYSRLLDDYFKHGTLVVAVDFDGTVFDLHNKGFIFPKIFRLLYHCQRLGFKIVAFSASPKERHDFIREHFKNHDIILDGINADVFITWRNPDMDYSRSKIFYNILLCDRAGLPSAVRILERLVKVVSDY